MRTTNSSEYSDSSRNSRVPNNYSMEQESDKASQQPSVIRGSFTQIMVKSDAVTGPRIHSMVRQAS